MFYTVIKHGCLTKQSDWFWFLHLIRDVDGASFLTNQCRKSKTKAIMNYFRHSIENRSTSNFIDQLRVLYLFRVLLINFA